METHTNSYTTFVYRSWWLYGVTIPYTIDPKVIKFFDKLNEKEDYGKLNERRLSLLSIR